MKISISISISDKIEIICLIILWIIFFLGMLVAPTMKVKIIALIFLAGTAVILGRTIGKIFY